MADDPNKRGWQDRVKVSLTEAHELRYWTKRFGCTEAELRAADAAVGHGAKAIEAHLAQG
jgi:hypothetical protein